jgi:hypothetical protein
MVDLSNSLCDSLPEGNLYLSDVNELWLAINGNFQ